MKRILLYLAILLQLYPLYAQHPVTIHLSEKDGLPDIEFYDIIEDSKGFIWLAADKGLFRYDGEHFKNFTNKEKRGLSVFELFEDHKGRIWCVNISGQFFYVENGQLITFIDLGNKQKAKGELFDYLVTDKYLLIFGSRAIYSVSLISKQIKEIHKANGSQEIGVPFYYKNLIYFQSGTSIYRLSPNNTPEKQFSIKEIYEDIQEKGTRVAWKSSFFKVKDTCFFLQHGFGSNFLYRVDMKTGEANKIKLPSELATNKIDNYLEKDDSIWFATRQGVIIYDYQNDEFIFKERLFEENYTGKMIIDQNENYWFITLRNGVYVVPNIYINQHDIFKGVENLSCLEKINENILFFGTTKGKAGFYDIANKNIEYIDLPSERRVTSLLYNSGKNEIYISQGDQSSILDYSSKTLMSGIDFISAKNLSIVDDNTFIYTYYSGARILKNVSKKTQFSSKELLPKRTYTSHYSKRDKKSYIAYVDNLVVHDSILRFKNITNNEQPIFALDLAETKDGTIWVSTFKDGIFGIKNDTVLVNYTIKEGLISNQTGKIKEDENKLWITTDKGIQLLDTSNGTFQTLTGRDGIIPYTISDVEILGDKLILATNQGFVSVEKAKAFKNQFTPKVYFTQVQIQEKDTLILNEYTLPYDQNAIKLSFHTNDFQSKENIRYRYRLLGYNDSWLTTDIGIGSVKYNSLPPGKYTFQVKSSLISSRQESEIDEIHFSIQLPFWKEWWFYGAIISVLILGIWQYFVIKIKKLRIKQEASLEKERINKKLVLSQLENLRSQMNPHFIFNALNSIQEYIVLNEKDLASVFLVKFSRLIRMYLEHSRKDEVSLREELQALKIYLELEKDRFEDILDYTVDVKENVAVDQIKIPPLFIQPYIENALKHGLLHKKKDRKLEVTFSVSDKKDELECSILDNGIGREASKEINKNREKYHTSFATGANQKRVDLLNSAREKKIKVNIEDLHDGINVAQGTRVSIIIPI
ncbi:histidine kinase [Aquimarina sp. 2201CG5-10]|uniref:sensor histidine kinase n=1 Tax=Aquimarina callyspongiae TaxID=3098150 RepID=UPI002AB58C85|nr:histidine kinase [Aquimarina sp. 2201CG5-10]MDY8137867.1 histidine kinase [Aquimarina sp. 2201CG5-10]